MRSLFFIYVHKYWWCAKAIYAHSQSEKTIAKYIHYIKHNCAQRQHIGRENVLRCVGGWKVYIYMHVLSICFYVWVMLIRSGKGDVRRDELEGETSPEMYVNSRGGSGERVKVYYYKVCFPYWSMSTTTITTPFQ